MKCVLDNLLPFKEIFFPFFTTSLQPLISAGRTNIRPKAHLQSDVEQVLSVCTALLSVTSSGKHSGPSQPLRKEQITPGQGHRRHHKVPAWQREAQRHRVPHLVQNNSFKENNPSEQAGPLQAGSSCSYWKSCHHARPHQHWIYRAAFLSRKCLCGAEQAGSSRTELCPCPQALP